MRRLLTSGEIANYFYYPRSQKAYIIFRTLRLKKKINHHSSRIEFRQLETRAPQVPISTTTSSMRLLKTQCVATCGCWQIPKTFGRVRKSCCLPNQNSWKYFSAPTDFLRFFCLLAANQRKWKEVRIVNAKIMIWAGNLNLDYAARFLFPEEYCVVVLVLHNSIIVHHHLAKCYVRVLSPFFFFLSPWILLG